VPIGAVGFVAMVAELLAQLVTAGEDPSRLYFPTGSLGTQAGLVVGVRAFSAPFAVYGVAVEHPVEQLIADGVTLANGTAELLGTSQRFSVTVITIDGAFIGAAYGVPTDEGIEAIRLLAKTEAVFLDPVYSGKAMAALISHARVGQLDPNEAVVFLHTGGGPSLFATGTTLV
jgi:1-aminocyclopropane-1-carboxylate deaminase/D-cysteine desulfhydrase-like pyridoxal-dependent ACC family enzyme